jgi:hypothetical protein
VIDLPITGWRNIQGWCISTRSYADFAQHHEPILYNIPLCDRAEAITRIKELEDENLELKDRLEAALVRAT